MQRKILKTNFERQEQYWKQIKKLMNKKNFKELWHELFLTTRQTTKIRNAFADKMSTDIKLSEAQISNISPDVLNKKSWNFCVINYINMVDISSETY